jgi:phosphodiesterase/alkaline phosphatase D-like protein
MEAWGSRATSMPISSSFKETAIGGLSMNRLLLTLAVTTTVGSLFSSNHAAAQVLPPAKKAERVEITKGPELESANNQRTIIRWTTNNPGGSDVHYGVVQYGTDPKDLSQTAKNPIRLNRGHPDTTFRVRIEGLKPRTTYYYRVSCEESGGKSDGVKSAVKKFTTPDPGERIEFDPNANEVRGRAR